MHPRIRVSLRLCIHACAGQAADVSTALCPPLCRQGGQEQLGIEWGDQGFGLIEMVDREGSYGTCGMYGVVLAPTNASYMSPDAVARKCEADGRLEQGSAWPLLRRARMQEQAGAAMQAPDAMHASIPPYPPSHNSSH